MKRIQYVLRGEGGMHACILYNSTIIDVKSMFSIIKLTIHVQLVMNRCSNAVCRPTYILDCFLAAI